MRIHVQMFQPFGIKRGRAAYDSVYCVAPLQQKFGKKRPVLSGDSSDQGAFHRAAATGGLTKSSSFWTLRVPGGRAAHAKLNRQIVPQKIRRIGFVSKDSTELGRQQKHMVGFFQKQILESAIAQPANQRRLYLASMSSP